MSDKPREWFLDDENREYWDYPEAADKYIREKLIPVIERAAYDSLLKENERLANRYRLIELAYKEMSRNDHVVFGEPLLTKWRLNVLKAVEAQAEDETLWCTDVTVAEAYIQQSLRWLHALIEDNDMDAFKRIVSQSKGDI